ncbi:MAG: hypothetical protein PHY62_02910 [Gallionella sp.]|nr:hypothetical protein [Gallionella sp.]
MKKIVLSIAGVMAAAAFAPEASALPAFARQTGMACTACHAQHFPVLNGFGRAFKAAGYTMMGAQEKVEGEHLSIPATLNAAILAKVRYQKDNGPRAVPALGVSNTPSDGMLQFGDEFSLFFAGRVAENIGFLFEGNTAAVGGALLAGFKLPVMFDMGGAKIGLVPFTTDALGAMYGYELSSGGVMRANRWAEHRSETSAVQYIGVATAATGFTGVAQNDMGYVAFTKFSPDFAMGANGGGVASYDMKNSYFRIAATPTIGDWALVGGIGHFSGTSSIGSGSLESRATFFDVQAQAEVGGKELGIYAQHANAPAIALGAGLFNAGIAARSATTIGADYTVIPHTLSIGAAYRNAKTGAGAGVDGDNAITLTAVYDLVQNVALHVNYSSYSGSSRNAVGAVTSLTTLMLEASW